MLAASGPNPVSFLNRRRFLSPHRFPALEGVGSTPGSLTPNTSAGATISDHGLFDVCIRKGLEDFLRHFLESSISPRGAKIWTPLQARRGRKAVWRIESTGAANLASNMLTLRGERDQPQSAAGPNEIASRIRYCVGRLVEGNKICRLEASSGVPEDDRHSRPSGALLDLRRPGKRDYRLSITGSQLEEPADLRQSADDAS